MKGIDAKNSMIEFLRGLWHRRCRGGPDWYFLDQINSDFYLTFDISDQPEFPTEYGTADVYIVRTGEVPENAGDIRLCCDADEESIANLLCTLYLPYLSQDLVRTLKCYGMREQN